MAEYRLWIKISLFLSSYLPLWLIFFFSLFINDNYRNQMLNSYNCISNLSDYTTIFNCMTPSTYALFSFLILIIAPLAVLVFIIYGVNRDNNPDYITIKEKENSTSEYALYAVSYIIPFVANEILNLQNVVILLIMMSTIGSIYIQSNMFYLNPILNLFRYKLYKISDNKNDKYTILTKHELKNGEKIMVNELAQKIFITQ